MHFESVLATISRRSGVERVPHRLASGETATVLIATARKAGAISEDEPPPVSRAGWRRVSDEDQRDAAFRTSRSPDRQRLGEAGAAPPRGRVPDTARS